jgi:hypothetical protein
MLVVPPGPSRTDAAGRRSSKTNQVVLTEAEVRAFSSLLSRVSERPAAYEEQTHQDRRYTEELQATAGDLLNRLNQESHAVVS